ncbi:MAG: beta-propeller fold lactonase family protein [Isosphaeraceae bacterium]|nr:beta-propeller fold lactonase family protein [Isosphaeraceae bacterium]
MAMHSSSARLALVLPVLLLFSSLLASIMPRAWGTPSSEEAVEPHRSPIALALSADGTRLLSANQTAGSVSLVDVAAGKVLHEVSTGDKPAGVALSRDGRRGVVTHWYGYDLAILAVGPERLEVVGRVAVGPEPRGVCLAPDGRTAYVAVGVANEVVRIDLESRQVTGRLTVGREPRGIALSPDGKRLLVGNARSQEMSIIAVEDWTVERTISIDGDNLRQVAISADGTTGYVANMKNRRFPTTKNNIDVGWVLGQRLTRVRLDGSEPFATISLDPRGQAVADVHGVAISGDGRFLAVSSGGTHEVVLLRTDLKRLPWRLNNSRDLLAPELLTNDGRYRRVPTGGRPTELAFAPDHKTLYVANYLADAIQVIDAEAGEVVQTIPLGSPKELSLARRGEILFHDATRSFNQWYSCNTCHSDGHTNGLDFDTMNDGWHDNSTFHTRSRKKVPTLRRVAHTGPWTWHGWQKSLDEAMIESFTKSMQGPKPSAEDVAAIVAYLETLDYPRNPYREPDGSLTPAAQRGEAIFRSAKAACHTCHGGPEFTDGKIHDVGLDEPGSVYHGFNPPSLRGVYDKDPYLHDGRARTLRDALTDAHDPEVVTGLGRLTEEELEDLIAYLKSL